MPSISIVMTDTSTSLTMIHTGEFFKMSSINIKEILFLYFISERRTLPEGNTGQQKFALKVKIMTCQIVNIVNYEDVIPTIDIKFIFHGNLVLSQTLTEKTTSSVQLSCSTKCTSE